MTAQPSASADQWRILCVDDDPDVLEILRATLGLKHQVVVAYDGVEAVGMLDACDADFILCDIHMPNMDGFQTVEAIRAHPRYHDVPVFFLTAETDREMARRGFASGANLYLTKPFDPLRLLQNIDFFLRESGREPRAKRLTQEQVAGEARALSRGVSGVSGVSDVSDLSERRPAAVAPPPRPAAKPRVIVISPRATQLDRVCAALKDDFECVACADPLASLQQLFRYEPDLLIINPAIPKLSGWGLVQMIRQNARFTNLPIVLLDDSEKPMDARLVPTITDRPLLPPGASRGEIVAAARSIAESQTFRIRPKRASLAELTREEEELRARMAMEKARRDNQERLLKDRYRKIQDFIDRNFA